MLNRRITKLITDKKRLALGLIVLVVGAVVVALLISQREIPLEERELRTISEKKDFKLNEVPEFEFEYKKKEKLPFFGDKALPTQEETLPTGEKVVFIEEEDISIKAQLTDVRGGIVKDYELDIEYFDTGKINVKLPSPKRDFRPGKYHLAVAIEKEGEIIATQEQNFTWGVLAINTNKSIYLPRDRAHLQMTVLDDLGHTVCDANLVLSIKYLVSGIETTLSTEDGTIQRSSECGPKNVTYTPDYFTYYQVDRAGTYQLNLTATTKEGTYSISDSFEVRDWVPFDVERIGPTRIYPPAAYEMTLKIKANQDFTGEVKEEVPSSFEIEVQENELWRFNLNSLGDVKVLKWEVDWKAGETYELKYTFDAPDISPCLYLLGPLKFEEF